MNERIKQLTEQANAWYPDGYPSSEGGDAAWRNLVIFEKQDLQKFAELIVGECAGIYDKIDNGNLHMGTDNYLEALHKTFRS